MLGLTLICRGPYDHHLISVPQELSSPCASSPPLGILAGLGDNLVAQVLARADVCTW